MRGGGGGDSRKWPEAALAIRNQPELSIAAPKPSCMPRRPMPPRSWADPKALIPVVKFLNGRELPLGPQVGQQASLRAVGWPCRAGQVAGHVVPQTPRSERAGEEGAAGAPLGPLMAGGRPRRSRPSDSAPPPLAAAPAPRQAAPFPCAAALYGRPAGGGAVQPGAGSPEAGLVHHNPQVPGEHCLVPRQACR